MFDVLKFVVENWEVIGLVVSNVITLFLPPLKVKKNVSS